MGRIAKLVAVYFMLAGIAGHVLVLGVWVARPQLVWRAEERALGWLERQGLIESSSAAPADPEADLNAAFPSWQPAAGARLGPSEIRVNGKPAETLAKAARQLKDGDILELGPGVYRKGLFIKANRVTLRGHGRVTFDNAAVKGKGALVIRGDDAHIINIECRNTKVRDRNGACIRLGGRNLRLDHVYFHRSEQGVLTGRKAGTITISDSRFELLGKHGRAHGLYIGGGDALIIRDSLLLSSVSQGHEIKSRARRTLIERSVVASLGGEDSRLLDISNGGELIVRNSVLQEGPGSVNSDVIGFALEKRRHDTHHIELTNNIILLEGPRKGRLLHHRKGTAEPVLEGNLIIGAKDPGHAGMNVWVASREEAGLPAYPKLPAPPVQ